TAAAAPPRGCGRSVPWSSAPPSAGRRRRSPAGRCWPWPPRRWELDDHVVVPGVVAVLCQGQPRERLLRAALAQQVGQLVGAVGLELDDLDEAHRRYLPVAAGLPHVSDAPN